MFGKDRLVSPLTVSIDPRVALALYILLTILVVGAVMGVAALLRERRPPGTGFGLYESGAAGVTPPRAPVPTSYFLIAACFVIFDLEAAILFTWAVAAAEAGWPGLVSAGVFIGILLAALVYLWADGALDVGPRPRRRGADA